jgi:transposase InsO family protein
MKIERGQGSRAPLSTNAPRYPDSLRRYLCSVLDGYSRYLVHWEIRESMTEVEIILQRARENFPRPRRASSPTTGRSSLPATSRSSFGFAA